MLTDSPMISFDELLHAVDEAGQKTIGPNAHKIDQERSFPFISMAALHELQLQTLTVPRSHGGMGAGLKEEFLMLPKVLMNIAKWCSSTSQVFALHHSAVQHLKIYGTENQQNFFFKEILDGHYFGSFGTEAAPVNKLTRVENGYLLSGEKIFSTGSLGAKWALWRAAIDGDSTGNIYIPMVNLRQPNVEILDTWNGIGQRGTGSGKVIVNNVFIPEEHVLIIRPEQQHEQILFSCMFHVNFSAQFIGIAKAALNEAIHFVNNTSHKKESELILLRIGEMSAKVQASEQLMLHAANQIQAYQEGSLSLEHIQLATSQTKVISTDVVLDVTNAIFQVMGARSATTANNFDLYYRNARTLTLHDEVDLQRVNAGKIHLQLQKELF